MNNANETVIKTLSKQKNAIEKLLVKEDKTIDDYSSIYDILSVFPVISEIDKNSAQFKGFIDEVTLQHFLQGDIIIKQGTEADCCYFILSGSAGVYVNKVGSIFDMNNIRHIGDVHPGCVIGELGLLYNKERTASIISSDFVSVLCLSKLTFDKYVRSIFSEFLDRTIKIYSSLPYFQNIPFSAMTVLAARSQVFSVNSDIVFLKQGSENHYIYFIARGMFKIVKTLDFKKYTGHNLTPTNIQDDLTLYQQPSFTEKQSGNTFRKAVDVCSIGKGDFFGENAVLTDDELSKQNYSVISIIPGEVYRIHKRDFFENTSPVTVSNIGKIASQLPKDHELRKYYYESTAWKDFKQKYLNKIFPKKYAHKSLTPLPEINPLKGRSNRKVDQNQSISNDRNPSKFNLPLIRVLSPNKLNAKKLSTTIDYGDMGNKSRINMLSDKL